MRFSFYFKQGFWYLFALLYVLLALIVVIFIQRTFHNIYTSILSMLITFFFSLYAIVVFKKWYRLDKGLDGENVARKELDSLPPEYIRLYDFQSKTDNTDAIVIGPTGIWTIEVKNEKHENTETNIFLEKHLSQALKEAKSISEKFNLPVNPVLVFTNPKINIHYGLHKQKGVFVIGKKWLSELIQNKSLGSTLSPEETLRLSVGIKKSTSII